MQEKKTKIKLGNAIVEGISIPAISSSENWNEYLLEDKSVLKMKAVVTEIVRVDGSYDNDGNPLYVVKSSNVLTVSSPVELKKKE